MALLSSSSHEYTEDNHEAGPSRMHTLVLTKYGSSVSIHDTLASS